MQIERLLVSKKELKTIGIPYSPQHIARLEKVGQFPQRVRLGNGPRSRTGWVYDEVVAWIEARMNDRERLQVGAPAA